MVLALPELVIAFAFMFAWLGLVTVRLGYQHTFGVLLGALSNLLERFTVRIAGVTVFSVAFLGRWLDSANTSILAALGDAILKTEHAGIRFLHWSATLAENLGRALESVARETERAFGRLVNGTIPQSLRAGLRASERALRGELQRVRRAAAAAEHAALAQVHRLAVAIPAELSRGLAWPRRKIGVLEHELGGIRKRIRRLEKTLTVGGIAALVGATIFKEFHLGWLRCKGVNRAGRYLCGLSGAIETLAADALDVILATHLCQMATLMTKGARAAEPAFDVIIGMTSKLIQCQGAARPKPLVVDWHEPPSVVSSLTL